MRETQFIRQNEEKWASYERSLNSNEEDPERLRELFIHTTDDLSYSRTFYPNRSVRVYLNGLAQLIFLRIYRGRRVPWQLFRYFWTDELPQMIYDSRRAFRLSLFVFVGAIAVGVLSSHIDPEFARIVLGDDYVEMTRANIESGDPMAVYKQRGPFGMALSITFNNIYVAFLAFVLGLLFGLGTLVILLGNGIMVGAFQYYFYQYGLLQESALTIWIHGAFELSAIVIAGAAGLTMGRGIAFPGTYTRLQSFQRSARRGLKVMLGTVPLFVLAGIFESYLTRQTEVGDGVRALFILLCLTLIVFYFVWYPWYRVRSGRAGRLPDDRIPVAEASEFSTGRIQSAGEVLTTTFTVIRSRGGLLLGMVTLLSLLYVLPAFLLTPLSPAELFDYRSDLYADFRNLNRLYAPRAGGYHLLLLCWAGLTLLSGVSATRVGRLIGAGSRVGQPAAWLRTAGVALLVVGMIAFPSGWSLIGFFLLTPFLLIALLGSFYGFRTLVALLRSSLFRPLHIFGLWGIVLVMGWIVFLVANSLLIDIIYDVANWILYSPEQARMDEYTVMLFTFILAWLNYGFWLLALTSFGVLTLTLIEIDQAWQLRRDIRQIGQRPPGRPWQRRSMLILLGFLCLSGMDAQSGPRFDDSTYLQLQQEMKYEGEPPAGDASSRQPAAADPEEELTLPPLLRYLLIALLLSGTAWLVYLMWQSSRRGQKDDRNRLQQEVEALEQDLPAADVGSALGRAEAQQQWSLAVRLHYLAILQELQRQGLIRWSREKTNRAYLRELGDHPGLPQLRGLTAAYERHWFGDYPLDRAAYTGLAKRFRHLAGQLRPAEKAGR